MTGGNHSRRGNKYRARSVVIDGERFDSYAEYERWRELQLLEKAGEIRDLERQIRIPLKAAGGNPIKIRSGRYKNGRASVYVVDFVYFEGNARVFEDKKGFKTPLSKLKIAIVEAMYPGIKVRIT